MLEAVVGDCDDATLHHTAEGAAIGSIAAIYLHTVFDEDVMIQGLLQGAPTLFQSGGWAGRLGAVINEPVQTLEWARTVRLSDLEAAREYARAVYAATDAYLARLSAADLDREVAVFGQQRPRGDVLTGILLWHAISHQGEMSALKGMQGKKGLPF